jgi:hypothetical protein
VRVDGRRKSRLLSVSRNSIQSLDQLRYFVRPGDEQVWNRLQSQWFTLQMRPSPLRSWCKGSLPARLYSALARLVPIQTPVTLSRVQSKIDWFVLDLLNSESFLKLNISKRQIVSNLRSVLEAAGSSLENVVKVNVYLSDMGDFAAMNETYATLFPEPKPVSLLHLSNATKAHMPAQRLAHVFA